MNSLDMILMGLKNLWRRKVRTLLTVLGVIIGTASIVVMLSLGIGMDESFKQQLSMMGSLNVINVDIYYMPMSEAGVVMYSRSDTGQKKIDDQAIEAMKRLEGVEAVTPLLRSYLRFVSGRYEAYIGLTGIDVETLEAFDFKVQEGKLIDSPDSTEILFGSRIPMNFYNPRQRYSRGMIYYGGYGLEQEAPVDLMNDRVEMTFDTGYGGTKRPRMYKVMTAGILAESSDEKDYNAYISISALKKMLQQNRREQRVSGGRNSSSNQDGYEQAMVKVKDMKYVESVQKAINEMGYGASSLADILDSLRETSRTIQMVLGGIGAISLLVAALGITNTMIMSIYERTREIGIMKVLGCLLGDIGKMFLLEAGLIGAIGGLLGILFSQGVSFLMNKAGVSLTGGMIYTGSGVTRISIIPVWLMLAAVAFATFVGLVSGFYPARRAMKLSALSAIRTE